MDWGYGTYELTAGVLAPLSDAVVGAAQLLPGELVADVATGTGNCALAAARAGATVVGVDPAARLLDVARSRAAAEGLVARFVEGQAASLPLEDDAVDCATSVMGVIFEPDGAAAVAELRRVVRPGGRIVMTAWTADGAVHRAGSLLRTAVAEAFPGMPETTGTDWTDRVVLKELFAGCHVYLGRRTMAFTGASPAVWFADQEEHHPVWRGVKTVLDQVPGAWEGLRERSVELLSAANEDPSGFRVSSGWWLLRADVPHYADR